MWAPGAHGFLVGHNRVPAAGVRTHAADKLRDSAACHCILGALILPEKIIWLGRGRVRVTTSGMSHTARQSEKKEEAAPHKLHMMRLMILDSLMCFHWPRPRHPNPKASCL